MIQSSFYKDSSLNPEPSQPDEKVSVLIEVFDKLEFDPKSQGAYPGVSVQCIIKSGLAHIG
jgi:hypothetical protein